MIVIYLLLMLFLGIGIGVCLGGIFFYVWEISKLRNLIKDSERREKELNNLLKEIEKYNNEYE